MYWYFFIIEAPRETETIKFVASGRKSTRINPYDLKIGEVIGEGSFGVVYRGIYQERNDVAVKKVKKNARECCVVSSFYFVPLFSSL